jgi:hypothetical protein
MKSSTQISKKDLGVQSMRGRVEVPEGSPNRAMYKDVNVKPMLQLTSKASSGDARNMKCLPMQSSGIDWNQPRW